MVKLDTDLIAKLAGSLTGTQRLQEGAELAGSGLAVPMTQLRTRSARLELARTLHRYGAKSAEARTRQQAVAAAEARRLKAEERHERLAGPSITIAEGQASIAGKVTRGDKAAAGLSVVAIDPEGEERARACTARDGRYVLAVPADTDLILAVRKGSALLYRDRQPCAYPTAYRAVRDIEFNEGDACCNDQEEIDLVEVPDLTGASLAQARKILAEASLVLGKVQQEGNSRAPIIVKQTPKAGSRVAPSTEVALILAPGTKT